MGNVRPGNMSGTVGWFAVHTLEPATPAQARVVTMDAYAFASYGAADRDGTHHHRLEPVAERWVTWGNQMGMSVA